MFAYVTSEDPASSEVGKIDIQAEHLPAALNIDLYLEVKSQVNNTIVSPHTHQQGSH